MQQYGGNSGSAVVSSEGKIVGINNMSVPEMSWRFQLSSAINNDFVKYLVENYLIKGIDYQDLEWNQEQQICGISQMKTIQGYLLYISQGLQPNGIAYNC